MKKIIDHFFSVDLKPHEEVKLLVRRHSFTFFKHILIAILLAIPPLLVIVFVREGAVVPYVWSVAWLFELLLAIYVSRKWMLWYLDSFIVTDTRIVNVQQEKLFSRSISEASLYAIQDVRYEVKGLFATMFHFGTVRVRTAAGELIMDGIPDPRVIQDLIVRLQYESVQQKRTRV